MLTFFSFLNPFLFHGCSKFTYNGFLFVCFGHFSAVPHIVFVPKSLFLLVLVTVFPTGAVLPCMLITELSICTLRVDLKMLIGHQCDKEGVVNFIVG